MKNDLVVIPDKDRDRKPILDRGQLLSLVTDGKAPATQVAYRHAILTYIAWARLNDATATGRGFSRASVKAYVQAMLDKDFAPATINLHLTAIRQLAKELRYNRIIDPNTADGIQNVQGVEHSGRRLGHWLSHAQVQDIRAAPLRATMKGCQEFLVLALLLGCALRRSEASALDVSQITSMSDVWIIKDIQGKKGRVRSVPIPNWTLAAITDWQHFNTFITSGPLLRGVNRGGRLMHGNGNGERDSGPGITPQAIYYIVKKLAKQIDLPELGPHSLRRTWARAAYKQGSPLDQIKYILGHASIMTTEIYLGLKDLDLENPVMVEF